jgi:hypothetical protein
MIYLAATLLIHVFCFRLGRSNLEELGGKEAIMLQMSNPDPAVRYEALVATQKMMVRGWYVLIIAQSRGLL